MNEKTDDIACNYSTYDERHDLFYFTPDDLEAFAEKIREPQKEEVKRLRKIINERATALRYQIDC